MCRVLTPRLSLIQHTTVESSQILQSYSETLCLAKRPCVLNVRLVASLDRQPAQPLKLLRRDRMPP